MSPIDDVKWLAPQTKRLALEVSAAGAEGRSVDRQKLVSHQQHTVTTTENPDMKQPHHYGKSQSHFDWETDEETEMYVCASCGSDDWHANVYYKNRDNWWYQDEDCEYWCADCDGPVSIKPVNS